MGKNRNYKKMSEGWYNKSYAGYNNSWAEPKKVKRKKIDIGRYFLSEKYGMDEFHNDLLEVLSVQAASRNQKKMVTYILEYIKKHNIQCDVVNSDGNIYVTKGAVHEGAYYPCVVAHTDTVHAVVDGYKVYQHGDCFFGWAGKNQYGTGGDDKVGIFIALQMLRWKKVMKVAFFEDEEIGCIGSGKAQMTFFEDVGFVIQCDRKGNDEVITKGAGTELCSTEFIDEIKPVMDKYNYRTSTGSITDVVQLKNKGIECSVVNIGCGYYEPHTKREIVIGQDVAYCWFLVTDMIRVLGDKFHEHKKPVYQWKGGNNAQRALWAPTRYLDKTRVEKIEKDEYGVAIVTVRDKDCSHCKSSNTFYIDWGELTCSKCFHPDGTSVREDDEFYE